MDMVDAICHLEVEESTIVGGQSERRHFRPSSGEPAFVVAQGGPTV